MAIITTDAAGRINSSEPNLQAAALGTEIRTLQTGYLAFQTVAITADASGAGGITFTADHTGNVLDVIVRCTAASGSGTMTLRRSTTSISSAVTCATDAAVSRTSSLAAAALGVTKGETLNFKANGSADRGVATIVYQVTA